MNKIAFIDYILRCNWDEELLAEMMNIPTFLLRMWINGEAEPNKKKIYRVSGWISVKLDLNQDEVYKIIMGESYE